MASCGSANGPDLGLFCFLNQVVRALTGPTQLPPSSVPPGAWISLIAALVAVTFAVALLLSRVRTVVQRREAARRPAAYLQCSHCRALNPEGHKRCYSCGHPLAPAALRLEVAATNKPASDRKADPPPQADH